MLVGRAQCVVLANSSQGNTSVRTAKLSSSEQQSRNMTGKRGNKQSQQGSNGNPSSG
jgi:hypothetical protein